MDISCLFYRIRDWFGAIQCWLRHCNNRNHWRMAKRAFESYPFDYDELLQIERDKLKEMRAYFEKSNITMPETYAQMIRYISLAIRMLDIMLHEEKLFDYEGEMKTIELEEKDENGDPYYRLDMSDMVYHCRVKVNMNNLHRFVPDERQQGVYRLHPHEFYRLKAKYLYYKIRAYHTEEWWD